MTLNFADSEKTEPKVVTAGSPRHWRARLARSILWTGQADMQGKKAMVDIKGVAHFTIPVSDMERSKRFYTDIVGMKHLATLPNGKMAFFDAGGTCIILVKRNAPIHREQEGSDGVHHAFMVDKDSYRAALDHVRANGVDIFFEEDRQGGVVNGPRAYFRDPDGTCLEYIVLTSYSGAEKS